MNISNHAAARFLTRYEGVNLGRGDTDHKQLKAHYIKTDLEVGYLKAYIHDICEEHHVGAYGNGLYRIGKKCKAVYMDGTVVTIRPFDTFPNKRPSKKEIRRENACNKGNTW